MKLWKKKVKEFGKDFEQSEEFEKNEEIGDAEEFETEEPERNLRFWVSGYRFGCGG